MPVASRYYETALLMKALAFNRTLKPGRQAFVNTIASWYLENCIKES